MNEEQKNIETCLPEDILSEVANVPTDPQFVSLTDEALDPLKQQAAAQAGYDGYIKVAGTHKPYTFTSSVKQMKSNLIMLLRRLWRFPFGRGITAASAAGSSAAGSDAGTTAAAAAAPIRSLADMWQHYITRLKGNPEYGIPSRLSQLTDLPDAPALLADRKISGVPEAADGMSLVRLICDASAAATVTEITDNNEPWDYQLDSLSRIKTIFPNADKLTMNVKSIIISLDYHATYFSGYSNINLPYMRAFAKNTPINYDGGLGFSNCTFTDLTIPNLEVIGAANAKSGAFFVNCSNLETVNFPTAKSVGVFITSETNWTPRAFCPGAMFHNCPNARVLNAPECENLGFKTIVSGALDTIIVGKLKSINSGITFDEHLQHFEIGEGTAISLDFSGWNPTDKGATFLQNFRDYIALRLTDKGSGLTLTLSQEVRNAIHAAEDEYGIENIIITQKGWTISPAPN